MHQKIRRKEKKGLKTESATISLIFLTNPPQNFYFSKFWAHIVLVLRTGGYDMGTLFENSAVIFWTFSTYIAVITSVCTK